jgi:alpha-L-fucosidase
MFDSQATDYTIVKKTPYQKDILKPLAAACKKEGIKLFFYYSLLDWHDDNYFPRGRTGTKIPGRSDGNWEDYIAFMKAQLTELLTNYGEIAGIWFDGHWDQKEWDGKSYGNVKVDWHYEEIYKLIHDLQPQCLIGNNHHIKPIEGEDFQMFERDLPGQNTTGWGTDASDVGELPKEVCETINGSWGFNLKDNKHKSEKELVQYIIRSAGYGSNLLLNVGPMPNGAIQLEHIKSLEKVGVWMRENGETIYKTTGGPINPTDEMAITQRENTLYLHILDDSKELFFVENFKGKIKSIRFYKSKEKVKHKIDEYGLFIEVPNSKKDLIDTIIEIILK